MRKFWTDKKEQIRLLEALDPARDLLSGAASHHYRVLPCVDLNTIESFEELHQVKLPRSYRDYLLYFGAGGAGPYGNVEQFPDTVHQKNLSKPLNYSCFKGTLELDEPDESLKNSDGMLRIGHTGEYLIYLVVTGELRGNIVGWNSVMLFTSGPFDKWYERWIYCAFEGYKQLDFLRSLEVGMNIDEEAKKWGVDMFNMPNRNTIRFKYIGSVVELDDERNIEQVVFRKYSVAQSGF